MKISRSWLQDYLKTSLTTDDLVAYLIQLGHEVDAVEDEATSLNRVVIGQVKAREQHPDADRLGVCTVDVGEAEPRTIVCGAANARAGITVAVALEGAVLPGDFAIKQSKIRGVTSNGMICSAKELALGEDHEGIMELDTKAKPGTPFAEVLGKTDVILDVAVTPNRGDALSIYGLARDLAAAGAGTLKTLPTAPTGTGQPSIGVTLKTKNCMGFSGIEVTNFTNAPSPQWLQARLRHAGQRPRNLGVDVTNYIMLTYGQPLHAYDADKLTGNITVRAAKAGETFEGLNDTKLTLNNDDVLITDESGIIGLGGVLGGEGTAISENTTHIFLEAAWFDRQQIAKTGQAHQLQTDARYRFERGVDPALAAYANQAAAALLVEYGGAAITQTSITGSLDAAVATISYQPEFCTTFGGLDVPAKRQQEILENLGFTGTFKGETWHLTAPTWRTYMTTPEDIVEEVLRVIGYENIPAMLPPQAKSTLPLAEAAPVLTLEKAARRHLASVGFLETLTYSFIDAPAAAAFTDQPTALPQLDNPLDAEGMTTMRPSLLPGLLRAAVTNAARSTTTPQLAEVGTIFTPIGEETHAAGLYWPQNNRHWQGTQDADIFTAKAAALSILQLAGINTSSLQIKTPAAPHFHPGRSGQLVLGKTVLAEFGELHPQLKPTFDLKPRITLFTVNLTALVNILGQHKPKRKPFTTSDFPPVERDLAFLVDENVTAQDLTRTIQNAIKPLGKNVMVFDVYQGQGVPNGKKSLALSFTLQAEDRTLTDEEIHTVMDTATAAVQKHYQGELRNA